MLYNKLMQLQGHKQMFTQLRNLRVYIVKEVLLSEFVPYDSGSHPSHTLPGTRLGMSSWSIAKGKSKSGNIQMFSLSLFSSVQSLVISDFRQPHEPQHARLPCPLSSGQFSSVAQSCPTLRDPMNRSTPGLPVHHQLPESTQTHVRWVSDAIQPLHPLSSPSPPAPNLSQHPGLFQWVSSLHQVAIGVSASTPALPMSIQDWSPLGRAGWISLQSKELSRVFSNTTVQKHQFFCIQLSLQSNFHIHTWPLEKL